MLNTESKNYWKWIIVVVFIVILLFGGIYVYNQKTETNVSNPSDTSSSEPQFAMTQNLIKNVLDKENVIPTMNTMNTNIQMGLASATITSTGNKGLSKQKKSFSSLEIDEIKLVFNNYIEKLPMSKEDKNKLRTEITEKILSSSGIQKQRYLSSIDRLRVLEIYDYFKNNILPKFGETLQKCNSGIGTGIVNSPSVQRSDISTATLDENAMYYERKRNTEFLAKQFFELSQCAMIKESLKQNYDIDIICTCFMLLMISRSIVAEEPVSNIVEIVENKKYFIKGMLKEHIQEVFYYSGGGTGMVGSLTGNSTGVELYNKIVKLLEEPMVLESLAEMIVLYTRMYFADSYQRFRNCKFCEIPDLEAGFR